MKSTTLTLASLTSLAAADTLVTWASPVNVVASPGALTKSDGTQVAGRPEDHPASSGWNAGAISTQQFTSSTQPQGVSFKCGDLDNGHGSTAMIGFGNTNAGENYQDIAYALYCDGCIGGVRCHDLAVYESGVHKGNFGTYTPSDVLEVQVTGTTVEYRKNGVVFYTSTTAATFPLHIDTSINALGSKFSDVTMKSSTLTAAPPTETCTPVTWKDTVSVITGTGSLERTSAAGSGWNGGAISTQAISASAETQSVSFTCRQADKDIMIGFGNTNSGNRVHGHWFQDIEFAAYCSPADDQGMIVYESGTAVYGREHGDGPDFTYNADDVFRVQVTGTTVDYVKNGVVFYTSLTAATFPLSVDVTMYNAGGKVTDVQLCSGPAATPAPTGVPTAPSTATAEPPTATEAPTAPTCTDTPASAAAVGVSLSMEGTSTTVEIDLLDDGTYLLPHPSS